MTTPTSDQHTQCELFSPQNLLNEDIIIITRNFTPSKFTNHMVYCIFIIMPELYIVKG